MWVVWTSGEIRGSKGGVGALIGCIQCTKPVIRKGEILKNRLCFENRTCKLEQIERGKRNKININSVLAIFQL